MLLFFFSVTPARSNYAGLIPTIQKYLGALNKYATHNSQFKRRVYYNICTELYMCCILEWKAERTRALTPREWKIDGERWQFGKKDFGAERKIQNVHELDERVYICVCVYEEQFS